MKSAIAFVMYGQGGAAGDAVLTMGGTKRLNDRIRALGVDAPGPFTYNQYADIAARIKKLPADTIKIIGGTSLGACNTPVAAGLAQAVSIDFIFGIQPSIYGTDQPITSNVKRAMYFYAPWWWPITFGLGQRLWHRATANHATTLIAYQTFLPHPGDNQESVQGPILAEISKLIR